MHIEVPLAEGLGMASPLQGEARTDVTFDRGLTLCPVQAELVQMEVHIGVVEHSLLQVSQKDKGRLPGMRTSSKTKH